MILMFGLIIIASASSSATGGARYLLVYYPPWSKTLVPGKGKSVSSHGPSASAVSSADGKKSAGQVCVIARPSRVGRRHGGCEKGRRASLCHRTSHPRRPLSVRMGKSPHGRYYSYDHKSQSFRRPPAPRRILAMGFRSGSGPNPMGSYPVTI